MHGCTRLYVGTDGGLRQLTPHGDCVARVDSGPVRDLSVHPENPEEMLFGCALGGHGLARTIDGGETAETIGFGDRWVWGVDRHPADPETVYVGTEPPGLFRSTDGGETFEELVGIHEVTGRDDWTFWYEPYEAGHVHGVATHIDRPERLFAAVEIGGLLVSEDGGDTWRAEQIGADTHRTLVSPDDPDHVLATTETGLVESRDGGQTWEDVATIGASYVKEVRTDGGTIYALAADEMTAETVQVYTADNWEPVTTLSPASVTAFAVVNGRFVIQGEDGRLRTSDGGEWTPIGPALETARCLEPV